VATAVAAAVQAGLEAVGQENDWSRFRAGSPMKRSIASRPLRRGRPGGQRLELDAPSSGSWTEMLTHQEAKVT
jgi:hypothetical protein